MISRIYKLVLIALVVLGLGVCGPKFNHAGDADRRSESYPHLPSSIHIDTVETLNFFYGNATPSTDTGSLSKNSVSVPPASRPIRRFELAPVELFKSADRDNPYNGRGLEVHVFAIGQADSTFVVGPSDNQGKRKTMLIDVGETSPNSKNYQVVADKIEAITGKKELDYFVATHFHSDHLGGATNGISGLLNRAGFKVGTVIDVGGDQSGYFAATNRPTFDTYQQTMSDAVGDSVTNRIAPRFGADQIKLGGNTRVELLAFAGKVFDGDTGAMGKVTSTAPNQYRQAPPSENDLSIAFMISSGKFEMFTGGDLSGADDSENMTRLYTERSFGGDGQTYTNVESWMVKRWTAAPGLRNCEVYRVNHHGSEYSTTVELLNALNPEFMVYSCAGRYGHPSRAVVTRGATTAKQLVTSKISTDTWSSDREFVQYNGEVVGNDIDIYVDQGGDWYWINEELHKAFSDDQEGHGDDNGEENVEHDIERH